jgi:hypothetical protein
MFGERKGLVEEELVEHLKKTDFFDDEHTTTTG